MAKLWWMIHPNPGVSPYSPSSTATTFSGCSFSWQKFHTWVGGLIFVYLQLYFVYNLVRTCMRHDKANPHHQRKISKNCIFFPITKLSVILISHVQCNNENTECVWRYYNATMGYGTKGQSDLLEPIELVIQT